MEKAADRIRDQLTQIADMRAQTCRDGLEAAVLAVKSLQCQRFRGTYADVLTHPVQGPAAQFFLEELYSDRDFTKRDAQFSRIAGALERMFPPVVTQLAVDLIEVHALTESLDHELAAHWLALNQAISESHRYVRAWRLTGQRAARMQQLESVLHVGSKLQDLTRHKSLLIALKMMRGPAKAAGLPQLQAFLERGFTTFAAMRDAQPFLATIAERERHWIATLFDSNLDDCSTSVDTARSVGRSGADGLS